MFRLIDGPYSLPVTSAAAKAHARIVGTDQDTVVDDMLAAATAYVAKAAELVLAPSIWRLDRSCWWAGYLKLAIAPVRGIESIGYLDEAGDLQIVDPANYRWARRADGADLWFETTFDQPDIADDREDAVQITVAAGFDDPVGTGTSELTLPPQAVAAIKLMFSHFFEHREAVSPVTSAPVPLAASALIDQIRVYR